jgi:phage shock protein A
MGNEDKIDSVLNNLTVQIKGMKKTIYNQELEIDDLKLDMEELQNKNTELEDELEDIKSRFEI